MQPENSFLTKPYADSARARQPSHDPAPQSPGPVIQFLVPDADGAFTPTLPSVASRKIALRSKASKRGALVTYFGQRRAVVFESHLELMTALMLLRLPGISIVIDQPPAVTYVDFDGVVHKHTLDYLVAFVDGTRWAVAVKPHDRAVKTMLRTTLELIASQNEHFAHQFHLVTEKSFGHTQVANARLMHHISYEVDEHTDAALERLVASMSGTCTIADLVATLGAGARGYRAVVRFLAHGTLHLMSAGSIRYSSIVGKVA